MEKKQYKYIERGDLMTNEEKEKEFEDMIKFALLNKYQKSQAELSRWEYKAKGKDRKHQF
jgi:ribosome-binding protein aMBF1 (putative translation factor)